MNLKKLKISNFMSLILAFLPVVAYADFFQEMESEFQRKVLSEAYRKDTANRKKLDDPSSYGDLSAFFSDFRFSFFAYVDGDPKQNSIPLKIEESSSISLERRKITGFIIYEKGGDFTEKFKSMKSDEKVGNIEVKEDAFVGMQKIYAVYTLKQYEGNNFLSTALNQFLSEDGLGQKSVLFYEFPVLNQWLFGPGGFIHTNLSVKVNKLFGALYSSQKSVFTYSSTHGFTDEFEFMKSYPAGTHFLPTIEDRVRESSSKEKSIQHSLDDYTDRYARYRAELDASGKSYTFSPYFSKERQKEQDKLLTTILEPYLSNKNKSSEDLVKNGDAKPQFVLLAGPVASGKSHLLPDIIGSGLLAGFSRSADIFNDVAWAQADADLMKPRIIEFETYRSMREHNSVEHDGSISPEQLRLKQLSDVHRESSYLTDLFIKILMDHKVNLIWPGTYDWEGFPELIWDLMSDHPDYNFQMIEVTAPLENLLAAAESRSKTEGRGVPKARIINSFKPGEDVRFMLRSLMPSFVIENDLKRYAHPWLRSIYLPRGIGEKSTIIFKDMEVSVENVEKVENTVNSAFKRMKIVDGFKD
jgi:hypothetical protein